MTGVAYSHGAGHLQVLCREVRPERSEGVVIVYDGGILSAADVKEIVLGDDEVAGNAFVDPAEAAERVTPLLARRIGA